MGETEIILQRIERDLKSSNQKLEEYLLQQIRWLQKIYDKVGTYVG